MRAVGAVVTRARSGYYDQAARVYSFMDLNHDLEILALMGNVLLKDGKPFVHVHVTLGNYQGRTFGGHLAESCEVFACEFEIEQNAGDKPLERGWGELTGLML
ncbi:conserved hypothetical protein [Desulfarculales bacterium]